MPVGRRISSATLALPSTLQSLTRLPEVGRTRKRFAVGFPGNHSTVDGRPALGRTSAPSVEKMTSWPRLRSRNSLATCLGVFSLLLLVLVSPASGLTCYRCGQYTEGMGSITPCINLTEYHLRECPLLFDKYCIKYVNGGSVVRDCAYSCVEKDADAYGTSTFCCTEDGCNAATTARLQVFAGSLLLSVVFLNRIRLSAFAFLQGLFLLFCLFY